MEKKQLDLGEFANATTGFGEAVPLFANGQRVIGVSAPRNAAGDLEVHLLAEQDALAAPDGSIPASTDADRILSEDERRANDPASLTPEEQESLKLTEKLGGVKEQREDLGDHGSESEPL